MESIIPIQWFRVV